MNRPSKLRAIALLSLSAALGGCLYPAHTASTATVVSITYIANEPPPLRAEVATARRSDSEVWVAGHWAASKNDYVWTYGRWARPDTGKTEWQEGKWEHEDHGWHYTEGSWR
jgi:hypothetical protein